MAILKYVMNEFKLTVVSFFRLNTTLNCGLMGEEERRIKILGKCLKRAGYGAAENDNQGDVGVHGFITQDMWVRRWNELMGKAMPEIDNILKEAEKGKEFLGVPITLRIRKTLGIRPGKPDTYVIEYRTTPGEDPKSILAKGTGLMGRLFDRPLIRIKAVGERPRGVPTYEIEAVDYDYRGLVRKISKVIDRHLKELKVKLKREK